MDADRVPNRRSSQLRCLQCGRIVRFAELGALAVVAGDRTYLDCPACDARNEIRTEPRGGAGEQPVAVVVRILN